MSYYKKNIKIFTFILGLVILLIFLVLLSSCKDNTPKNNRRKYSLAVPNGSPNIAVAGLTNLFDMDKVSAEDGPQNIAKHFTKGEKDIIVGAVIQGALLSNKLKENFNYHLHAIIAKNNFYMASVKEERFDNVALKDKTIGRFGVNETPGALLNAIYPAHSNYKDHNSVKDLLAPILTGSVDAGIIAEPLLTVLKSKAKEANKTLHFQKLTELLPKDFGDIYQAGLFINKNITDEKEIIYIKEEFQKNYDSFINNSEDYLDKANGKEKKILNIVDTKQLQLFKKAAPNMGICFEIITVDILNKVKAFLEFNKKTTNKNTIVTDSFFNITSDN